MSENNLEMSTDPTKEEEVKGIDSPSKIPDDEVPVVQGETVFDYPAVKHDKPCEDPSQYIWSEEKAVYPESFVESTSEYDPKGPPPKYLTKEELLKPKAVNKEDIMSGFKMMKDGQLVCTDQEAMDKQSGILMEVLRQLTINLMQGLTITHISMPVRIFEARTSLERICDLFSHAPHFLNKAAETDNHQERLKHVISYALSSIYMICGQNKPFNPLLGETMQNKLGDDAMIYGEHTSHHPPISNYLIEQNEGKYKVHGYVEFVGAMGANHIRAGQKGPHTVEFEDGHKIRFALMDYKLGGTIRGARTVEPCGNFVFEDLTNNVRAIVVMGTYKKEGFWTVVESGGKDMVEGLIYQPKEQIDEAASFKKYFKKNPTEIANISEIKDCQSEIAKVSGSVVKSL
jgi:hypothetical protein